MENDLVAVQHDGEYVLTASGSKDFCAENYGEVHIERAGRLKQLQNAGFKNARDFVDFGRNHKQGLKVSRQRCGRCIARQV